MKREELIKLVQEARKGSHVKRNFSNEFIWKFDIDSESKIVDDFLASHLEGQTQEDDKCNTCIHNKPELAAGYFCLNNCISGSRYEPQEQKSHPEGQQRQEKCTDCNGNGWLPFNVDDSIICPSCDGSGEIERQKQTAGIPSDEFIYEWLKGKNFQTDYGEQEYRMYFAVDMPKIIRMFLEEYASQSQSLPSVPSKEDNGFFTQRIGTINGSTELKSKSLVLMSNDAILKEVCGYTKNEELNPSDDITISEAREALSLLKSQLKQGYQKELPTEEEVNNYLNNITGDAYRWRLAEFWEWIKSHNVKDK